MNDKEVNRKTGESPLALILGQLGGISMTEFARRIGCDKDTVRGWVKGRTKEPKLTIPQVKRLVELLNEAGIPLSEFPDSLSEKEET